MKKIILVIVACCMAGTIWAQTASQYLELANHPELVNPSYESGQKGISALVLYGEKWSGFKGAQKTTGFNASYGFNKFVGVGIKGDFEKVGHRHNNIIGANADVNIRISEQSYLGFGLYLGAEMWHYSLEDAVNSDNGMVLENYDKSNFIGGFGLTYRWKRLVVGASSYISFYADETNMANCYFTGSYDFSVSKNWYIRPLAMYCYNNRFDNFYEAGAMFGYRNLAGVGATYRENQGINIMANVEVIKMLTVGACYGINTGELSDLSKKSFEISLGFKMNRD